MTALLKHYDAGLYNLKYILLKFHNLCNVIIITM